MDFFLPPWNSRWGLENVTAAFIDIGVSRKWVKLQFWVNYPFKFSVFGLLLPVRFYLWCPPSFPPSHRCLIRPFPCYSCLLFFGVCCSAFSFSCTSVLTGNRKELAGCGWNGLLLQLSHKIWLWIPLSCRVVNVCCRRRRSLGELLASAHRLQISFRLENG